MTATVETPVKTTEQLVDEHERMILDLQLTISDIAQGKFGVHHAEFAGVKRELESAQYELYLQDCQIAELKQSIEDLMAGGVATTHQPEIRVRIGHTHTLKDGWRCDSTTVEWTGRGEVDWGAIRDELKNSHIAGDEEAKARHAEAIAPSS